MINKHEIIERLKQHYGFQTNTQLANKLGVAQNTISGWIKRNSIDYDLIFSKCDDVDLNWLLSKGHIKHEPLLTDDDIKFNEDMKALTGSDSTNAQIIKEIDAECALSDYFHDFFDLEQFSKDDVYIDIDIIYSVTAEYDLYKLFSNVYLQYKQKGDIRLLHEDFCKLYHKCKEAYNILLPYRKILGEIAERLLSLKEQDYKAVLDRCEEEDRKRFFNDTEN